MMKDTIKLKWFGKKVPKNMEIRQVYGVIFSKDGRILLEGKKDSRYCLVGGTVESFDENMEATLRREVLEEVNVEIDKPIYLGYQQVDEGDKPIYAQVRMAVMLTKVGISRPDPDKGETYQRLLTHPKKAIRLLNWPVIGRKIIRKAVRVAKRQFGIKKFSKNDEII